MTSPTDPLLVVDSPLVVFAHHHLDAPLPVITLQDDSLGKGRCQGSVVDLPQPISHPIPTAGGNLWVAKRMHGQPIPQLPEVSGARLLQSPAEGSRSHTPGSSSVAHLREEGQVRGTRPLILSSSTQRDWKSSAPHFIIQPDHYLFFRHWSFAGLKVIR